jgi:hypothetical protein
MRVDTESWVVAGAKNETTTPIVSPTSYITVASLTAFGCFTVVTCLDV